MEIATLITVFENLFRDYGLLIVFVAAFVEMSPVGWMLPGGVVLAIAGFFNYGSPIDLVVTLFVATASSMLTLTIGYYLGEKTGGRVATLFRQEKNRARAKIVLERHGAIILTTSMIAGLIRFWVAYVAGEQKYNLKKFLTYSFVASFTYNFLMIVVGYFAGAGRGSLERGIAQLGILGWVMLFVAIGVIAWTMKMEKKSLEKI